MLSDNESHDYSIKATHGETSFAATDRSELSNNNLDEDRHSDPNRDIPRRYLITMVGIGCVMLCFYEGMENINFEYQSTFFYSTGLNISEKTSDLIVSAMSAAYTVSNI